MIGTYARGGSGGGRGSFGGSRVGSSGSRTGSTGRSVPRPSGGSRTTVNNAPHTVINNYTNVRVYGGRTYPYRGGGWGYGYYGPHVYIEHWYGYPIYYGYPGHWSGWDWCWFPLGLLLTVAAIWGLFAWLGSRD